jgi:hypothetical protein
MYALTCTDGSVQIMTTMEGVTPEEALTKWHPDEKAKVVSITEITTVPSDRTFRDGWTLVNSKVEHNIVKCIEIAKDYIRNNRKCKMEVLDSAYLKADEDNDKPEKNAVALKKQQLRDAPADVRITGASDIASLKTAMAAVIEETD